MFKVVKKNLYEKYTDIFGNLNLLTTYKYAFDNHLGRLEVDNFENPEYARFFFGDLMFFAGKANKKRAEEILATFPPLVAIVVEDKEWYQLIENFFLSKEGIKFGQQNRIKFSSDSLSIEHLFSLMKPLPDGFYLKKITKKILENLPPTLREHIPPCFGSNKNFLKKGMGFCILDDDKTISMASSYIPIYNNQLEVQIVTLDDPQYRRKGFATAACVALLKYCLENNLTPEWDAQNEESQGLAKKLGYTEKEKWKMYYYIEIK